MHHYCTHTARTICHRADMQHVWRVTIPEFGYRCTYVMHGILAIAALHKAHLLPSERETYLDLCVYYQTLGVRRFVSELQHVNENNWKPAFCFASTVAMYALFLPSVKRKEVAGKPLSHIVDLFMFVRGFRSIIAPFQGQMAASQLGPIATGLFVVREADTTFKYVKSRTEPYIHPH